MSKFITETISLIKNDKAEMKWVVKLARVCSIKLEYFSKKVNRNAKGLFTKTLKFSSAIPPPSIFFQTNKMKVL